MSNENEAKLKALEEMDSNINSDEKIQTTQPKNENKVEYLGWIDIKREELPYKGVLYPEHIKFQVRPANAKEIRHFSSLDESNPLSVNESLNYIINNCIRCFAGKTLVKASDVIYEHQRLFFVLLVQTYTGTTTSLTFDTKCNDTKCNHKQTVTVTPYNFMYSEISDKGYEYLDQKTGIFNISTKTLGDFRYRPLTNSESILVQDYMIECRKEGIDFESTFVELASFFMLDKKNTENIKDIYLKFLKVTSDPKTFSILKKIKDIVNVDQLFEVSKNCDKCNRPNTHKISTFEGIRNLFIDDNIDDELS